MADRFQGRHCLITGGGGGIGRAVATHLAAEGAWVTVTDVSRDRARDVAEEIRRRGGRAEASALDVTSRAEVEAVLRAAEERVGPVELAVTCAGICRIHPFLELPEQDWDATLAVNLKGTFLILQAVALRLVALGRPGRMVAIASVAGRGPRADVADYAASKAGVISVVRSAAVALARFGITVNAVCPGVVDTEMTYANQLVRAAETGQPPEVLLQQLVAKIPLGRIETPDDVARAVSFLLSEDAAYVTGQALNVCGGLEFD